LELNMDGTSRNDQYYWVWIKCCNVMKSWLWREIKT
jgi:hypothetical protein